VHKQMQSERTKCSSEHSWEKIQSDTSKFCGYYESIEMLNESGKNEDDRVSKFEMFCYCFSSLKSFKTHSSFNYAIEGCIIDVPRPFGLLLSLYSLLINP
jgi:hypothetical protein